MLRNLIPKLNKYNKTNEPSDKLKTIKKSVILQACLGLGSVVLAVILIFAATAAWYTNVAKTDTLRFQTEAWGYPSENIVIGDSDTIIQAAPGKNGVVPLKIDNSKSSNAVRFGISVVKNSMSTDPVDSDELQKRIFFYADTNKRINDEEVSRVYIGATDIDSYYYTVAAGDILNMSDSYYNDVPLKWEWVYDMQGYYFKGSIIGDTVKIDEYIRPIEYDLTKAVFEKDGDGNYMGNLQSVDSLTTIEFLEKISMTDGYTGTITADKAVTVDGRVYYKVGNDNSADGVWAYLCSYSEITNAAIYDTQNTQGKDITSIIRITAQNISSAARTVTSEAELLEALKSSDNDVVTLSNDLLLSDKITLDGANSKSLLDLNGYTLSYQSETNVNELFKLTNGAELTVINGDIKPGDRKSGDMPIPVNGFNSIGGELTLSNVNMSGFSTAVMTDDYTQPYGDSFIKIQNCNLHTSQTTIFIQGNGSATQAKTKVLIQGSEIISDSFVGISGQGSASANAECWGTDISIVDSIVKGYYAAIYHPQQKSDVLISSSELSGYCGIVVKGGTITVNNSKVTGTGAYGSAAASGGGWTDTGDAIYIEANYAWQANVIIKGDSVITSTNAYALDLFGVANRGPAKIAVYGGSFYGNSNLPNSGMACWNKLGSFEIYSDNQALKNAVDSLSE